jgi:hypothetical protein
MEHHKQQLAEFTRAHLNKRLGALARDRGWDFANCTIASNGALAVPLPEGVAGFLRNPRAWELVSRTTETLNSLFDDLTRVFTYTEPDEVRHALRSIEAGPPDETVLAMLREEPRMRPEAEVRVAFKTRGWQMSLCDALLPLVRARCRPNPSVLGPRYRKGFGFAMIATGCLHRSATLRILPVAELASIGMIEAMDVQLVRLRHLAPLEMLQQKSREYDECGRMLRENFGGHLPSA